MSARRPLAPIPRRKILEGQRLIASVRSRIDERIDAPLARELINELDAAALALEEARRGLRSRRSRKPTGDEHLAPTVENLIETVYEQGCVRLKSGAEGIPRSIKIDAEGELIEVDTDEGRDDVTPDEIEEIVFTG